MTYITAEASAVFGAFFFNENTTSQTPIAGKDIGIVNASTGVVQGFTFSAGEIDQGGAAITQKDATGYIKVTEAGHTVADGQIVFIQSANHNGIGVVSGSTGTSFDVATISYVGDEACTFQVPSQLELTQAGISNQEFELSWNLSGSVAGTPAGDIVDWGCVINATKKVETYQRRTLSTGSSWGSFGNGAILSLSSDDVVSMFFNSDDVNALTHRVGGLRVQRT